MRSSRRTPKPKRRQTRAEHLAEQYARGCLTFEEFDACISELVDLGIDDKPYTIPVSFDAALKAMYRGPIRDIPNNPTVVTLIDKSS